MSHVSLKDVAAKVGVTFPTVSKVLKGKGAVSLETRIAILQAAEELGNDDCAVYGCDDIPLSAHVFLALTTTHIPFFRSGEVAARLLHDLIVQDITTPQKILLPVH